MMSEIGRAVSAVGRRCGLFECWQHLLPEWRSLILRRTRREEELYVKKFGFTVFAVLVGIAVAVASAPADQLTLVGPCSE